VPFFEQPTIGSTHIPGTQRNPVCVNLSSPRPIRQPEPSVILNSQLMAGALARCRALEPPAPGFPAIEFGAWLSLARAPGSGPGGRWFESTRPDQISFLNQSFPKVDFGAASPEKTLCPFLALFVHRDPAVRRVIRRALRSFQTSRVFTEQPDLVRGSPAQTSSLDLSTSPRYGERTPCGVRLTPPWVRHCDPNNVLGPIPLAFPSTPLWQAAQTTSQSPRTHS
jgi:hypothetical protein